MSDDLTFSSSQLEAIARALGHTDDGLTGGEIGHLLATARIDDTRATTVDQFIAVVDS